MIFEYAIITLNIIVFIVFGFMMKKYFPVVKNISSWMSDVSSVSKETHDTMRKLYDPKEIEKLVNTLVNTKVEKFKIKKEEELFKTNEEYKEALRLQAKIYEEALKNEIKNTAYMIVQSAKYFDMDKMDFIKKELLQNLSEIWHDPINEVFERFSKDKINRMLMNIAKIKSNNARSK